jgi:hypothetical protein
METPLEGTQQKPFKVTFSKDQMSFKCPYCRKRHYHPADHDLPTFRTSHCSNPKSPLYGKSYWMISA